MCYILILPFLVRCQTQRNRFIVFVLSNTKKYTQRVTCTSFDCCFSVTHKISTYNAKPAIRVAVPRIERFSYTFSIRSNENDKTWALKYRKESRSQPNVRTARESPSSHCWSPVRKFHWKCSLFFESNRKVILFPSPKWKKNKNK